MASNKKGEGLVEKNTQHVPAESNTESLDGDIKVLPASTLDNESRGLTKNAKSPTHSTSGSKNTSIGLDNVNKVQIYTVIITDRIVTFSVHILTFILPPMKAVGGLCKISCICS